MAKDEAAAPEVIQPKSMLDAIASVDQFELPGAESEKIEAKPEAKVEAKTEKVEAKTSDAEAKPVTEEKPAVEAAKPEIEGILSKDGKRVIPYHVLEEARHQASAKDSQIEALTAKVAEYDAAISAAEAGEIPEIPDLNGLEGEFPEALVKPMQAMRAHLIALTNQNKTLVEKAAAQDAEVERVTAAAKAAQQTAALEKFPILKSLEENKALMPARYEQARSISKQLLSDKDYAASVTQEQHFADVEAKLKEAATQEAKLFGLVPAETKSDAKVETPAKPEAKPAKPLPALKQPAPASLSDLNGGTPPATSEAEAFLQQDDASAISNMVKLKNKSPAAFDAYMSRVYR